MTVEDASIEALEQRVTPRRLALIDRVVAQRTSAVVPVFEALTDPHNMAAVLRTCDALGIAEAHVIEGEQAFEGSAPVSRGAQRWVALHRHASAAACAKALRAEGYRVLVAALGGEEGPKALPALRPLALVFGNEHRGVSTEMRDVADGSFQWPMHGFVESLNISVAAALSLQAALEGAERGRDVAHLRRRYLEISARTRRERHAAEGRA